MFKGAIFQLQPPKTIGFYRGPSKSVSSRRPASLIVALTLLLCSCGTVPVQLKDAMEVQKQEIENVRAMYAANINSLLDALKAHQLEILRLHEEDLVARYSKALDEVNGVVKEVQATGDPDVDHIHLSTLQKIRAFFDKERAKVHDDMASRRKEYEKIDQNFQNIEAVNRAVRDYIASLRRLKNARDKATQAMLQRATGLTSLPVNLNDLPTPSTFEDLIDNLQP